MMRGPPIELVPIGGSGPPEAVLGALVRRLRTALDTPVDVAPPIAAPATASGAAVDADDLLDRLVARDAADPAARVIGLTTLDLNAPDRSFVFGVATVGGRWAVVSLARLHDDRSPDLFVDRLVKETLHELGHVAGLEHCDRPDCVMRQSRSVADVDAKSNRFCDRCRRLASLPIRP